MDNSIIIFRCTTDKILLQELVSKRNRNKRGKSH